MLASRKRCWERSFPQPLVVGQTGGGRQEWLFPRFAVIGPPNDRKRCGE